jgi:hypothetical protein
LNVPEPQSTEATSEEAQSEDQKLGEIAETEDQVQKELEKGDTE